MSSVDGQGKGTPRRTTRRSSATPVRDSSPPARGTRAASMAAQNTPVTRRSARTTTRRSDQPRDVVNNNVLPEIQTRQSYAYGSSKTPLLPEQLHVRETLTMNQVADQMQSAINQAEQNLDTHAADVVERKDVPQTRTSNQRATKRTSKEPSPPVSVTTELQKKQRTAAWASALDDDQLEDIAEEEQTPVDSPETKRTEPSSFPSGVFDQSYQYERGLRPPRRPPGPLKESFGTRLGSFLGSMLDRALSSLHRCQQAVVGAAKSIGEWLSRLCSSVLAIVLELPDSHIFSILVKTFFMLALTATMSYVLCFGYTRYLCDPTSTSRVSHALGTLCGNCQTTPSYLNLTASSQPDLRELLSALRHIDTQIRSIESRVNSRLDSQVSALHTDIDHLRKEQSNLIHQIEEVSSRTSQQTGTADVASPLINRVNYFSPANGAIVIVPITSPTRQAPIALPLRLLTRLFGVQKYRAHNPVMALETWHDVGDCWCAAATATNQDSIRLGVGVKEYIFPIELVIEHPPMEVSLTPETAPRLIELWADFSHLDAKQWKDLGLDVMINDLDGVRGPFGKAYAMIASLEYDMKAKTNHLQRFALDVNQYGDLKYSALDFAVRVRSTWGAEYGCLYRVRLHGVPVEQKDVVTSSADIG